MKKKRIVLLLLMAIIVLGFVLQDSLIQSYVSLCADKLEAYAVTLLDSADERTDSYGVGNTSCYPVEGMVEFQTGGWGLAPSSTYKGFYYSADNTHKVFSAADGAAASLEINGDYASWTDGTDNHGSSTRIVDKWFWYEASF